MGRRNDKVIVVIIFMLKLKICLYVRFLVLQFSGCYINRSTQCNIRTAVNSSRVFVMLSRQSLEEILPLITILIIVKSSRSERERENAHKDHYTSRELHKGLPRRAP